MNVGTTLTQQEKEKIISLYDDWKHELSNPLLSNFIDFCIRRIKQNVRAAFIQRLVQLDTRTIPGLFQDMLGIKINKQSLELPEEKIQTITASAGGYVLSPMVGNRSGNLADQRNTEERKEWDLESNLEESNLEESILDQSEPELQQKDIPSAAIAPISPAMKQFTQFQEWFSNKSDEEITAFNTWLSAETSTKLKASFSYDNLKSQTLKKAKQRAFLSWYEKQINQIVDFFETQKFNESSVSTKSGLELLKEFKERFSLDLVEIKHSFQDNTTLESLLSQNSQITQLIITVNYNLRIFYIKLVQRHVNKHYFYHSNNFSLTAVDYYQQYLDEQSWALQKEAFQKDPKSKCQDLVQLILDSDSSTGLRRKKPVKASPELTQGLHNRTSLEVLMHQEVNGPGGEKVPFYMTLSDEQRELLDLCLNHNPSELDDFIKKHGAMNVLSWTLPIVSYIGECVYFVVDFILRAKSFTPIFEAFGIGVLLEQKEVFLALNIATTFFVVIANVAFDPSAEALQLMKAWLLNPKNSKEKGFLSQLRGYFDTHFWDLGQKHRLLFLCFAGMAFSGSAIETIAIAELKPYLSKGAYTGMYAGGSTFLITSGMLYYFFMSFRDIIKDTPDAINAFKTTAFEIFFKEGGSLTFDTKSFIAFQQMLVAILERTLRMAYGPTAFLLGINVPLGGALVGGAFGGLTTFGATWATRVAHVAAAYKLDQAKYKEQLIKAKEKFESLTTMERGAMRLQDPFIIPAVGISYILASLTLDNQSAVSPGKAAVSAIVALVSFIALMKLSQASADCKIINNLASKEKVEGTLALRLSQTACAVDQFSRAVGFVSIMVALDAADFNTESETGKLLIQLTLILACYLGYAAYTYQSSKTNGICQGAADWVNRKVGQAMSKQTMKNSIFAPDKTSGASPRTMMSGESSPNLALELSSNVDPSKRLSDFMAVVAKR